MNYLEINRRSGIAAAILLLSGCRLVERVATPTPVPATPTPVSKNLILPDKATYTMSEKDAKWEIFLAMDENDLLHPETGYYVYTFQPRPSSFQWLEQTQQSGFRARLQFIPMANSNLIVRNVIGLSTEARSRRAWDTSIGNYSSNRENKYQAGWEKWMVLPDQTFWNDKPLLAPTKQPPSKIV